MNKYIETKNLITAICDNSGLSLTEISGILNECLSEVRYVMMNQLAKDKDLLEEQLVQMQAELAQLREGKNDSEEESE